MSRHDHVRIVVIQWIRRRSKNQGLLKGKQHHTPSPTSSNNHEHPHNHPIHKTNLSITITLPLVTGMCAATLVLNKLSLFRRVVLLVFQRRCLYLFSQPCCLLPLYIFLNVTHACAHPLSFSFLFISSL